MSTRRKAGDRVWVRSGAGFGAAGPAGCWATIMAGGAPCLETGEEIAWNPLDEQGLSRDYCVLQCPDDAFPNACKDPECREWANLEDEEGGYLCHVSECQMLDAPPPEVCANCEKNASKLVWCDACLEEEGKRFEATGGSVSGPAAPTCHGCGKPIGTSVTGAAWHGECWDAAIQIPGGQMEGVQGC